MAPGKFGSYMDFTKRYCGGHMGKFEWTAKESTNVDELRREMEPYIIVGKKADLLQLPPKVRRAEIIQVGEDKVTASRVLRTELQVCRPPDEAPH